MKSKKKNIILYVGVPSKNSAIRLNDFKKKNKEYKIGIIYPKNKILSISRKEALNLFDIALPTNFKKEADLKRVISPYVEKIATITTHSESNIPFLQLLIPYIPDVNTPSIDALIATTNKVQMRKKMRSYNKNISPSYLVVKDTQKKTIDKIEKIVGYPLVVKPSGLAQSLLVSLVFHRDELKSELSKVFRKIHKIHKESKGRGEAQVLVEQFMDGDMYSVDAYVTSKGKVMCCPPVMVKTGRTIGFDDFFGYQRILPTKLNKESITKAYSACKEAINSVALKSSTAHIELMKTEHGWRVIELGPRMGGFRHSMYSLCYGIDHTSNDVLVRLSKDVKIPKKVLGHTRVLQFFAKEEGYIRSLQGVIKSKNLESINKLTVNKKVGEMARYAKNGGKSVIDVILFNKDRSKVLADVRRIEKLIKIKTSKNKKANK